MSDLPETSTRCVTQTVMKEVASRCVVGMRDAMWYAACPCGWYGRYRDNYADAAYEAQRHEKGGAS